MTIKTRTRTRTEAGGDDDEKSSRANDILKTGADAAVELLGGVADAFGSAVRKAGDQVEKDDASRLDFKNGLVRGVVEGTAHFLDKLPNVVRSTYDVLTSSVDDKPAKTTKPGD
jgi:hypothetical protein